MFTFQWGKATSPYLPEALWLATARSPQVPHTHLSQPTRKFFLTLPCARRVTDTTTFSTTGSELQSPCLPAMWAQPSLGSPSTSSRQALPISRFQFSHRLPNQETPWGETAAVPRCGQTTEKESKNESGIQHPRAPCMGMVCR